MCRFFTDGATKESQSMACQEWDVGGYLFYAGLYMTFHLNLGFEKTI